MKRILIFIYGMICYAISLATLLYAIGFIGNFVVPKSIDSARELPLATALLVDLALLGQFAVQHSVMARPAFKRWWTRIVPETAERSTYILLASQTLITLFALWQPIGGVVWDVIAPAGRTALHAGFALGCALVLVSTFLINHFDLFGLRQIWLQLLGRSYEPLPFRNVALFQHVRHPLYLGFFFAFWSTPTMTVTHLVFALAACAYILVAIQFQERDLLAVHPEYADYRRDVPMLVPSLRRHRGAVWRATAGG